MYSPFKIGGEAGAIAIIIFILSGSGASSSLPNQNAEVEMRTIGLLRGAPMKGPIQNKGRKKRISAWVVADLSTGLSIDGD